MTQPIAALLAEKSWPEAEDEMDAHDGASWPEAVGKAHTQRIVLHRPETMPTRPSLTPLFLARPYWSLPPFVKKAPARTGIFFFVLKVNEEKNHRPHMDEGDAHIIML